MELSLSSPRMRFSRSIFMLTSLAYEACTIAFLGLFSSDKGRSTDLISFYHINLHAIMPKSLPFMYVNWNSYVHIVLAPQICAVSDPHHYLRVYQYRPHCHLLSVADIWPYKISSLVYKIEPHFLNYVKKHGTVAHCGPYFACIVVNLILALIERSTVHRSTAWVQSLARPS